MAGGKLTLPRDNLVEPKTMNDAEARQRIEQQIRSSPRSIRAANGYLLSAALLTFVHRIYYAYSHEIAIWKGIIAGLVLAILCFQAGLMLFQKKKWVYWAVLLISIAGGSISTVHGLAEILRFAHKESIRYSEFIFTMLYTLLAIGITWSLLRKESRDHFASMKSADSQKDVI